MLVISSLLSPTLIKAHGIGTTEVLHVSIRNDTLISLIYRPPGASISSLIELTNALRHYTSSFKNTYVMEDFNLPDISWPHMSGNSRSAHVFIEFCAEIPLS